MEELQRWLTSHGLGDFFETLAEERIRVVDLPDLTEADLRELGMPMGPRKQLLRAALAINTAPDAQSPSPPCRPRSRGGTTPLDGHVLRSDGLDRARRNLGARGISLHLIGYQTGVRAAIDQFGGYIARYMGAGLLVYFGYPHAHEDDADRSVLAALEIVSAMARLRTDTG
jgi:class 3 adenylate cyclase